MKSALTPLACSVLLTMSACSSGGGGGSNGINTDAVAITQANAEQIATTGLSGSEVASGDRGSVEMIFEGGSTSQHADIFVKSTLSKSTGLLSNRKTESISSNCDSGSVKLTFNDADNNQVLSSGDRASMTYYDCVEDMGADGLIKTNGSVSMKINVINGDLTDQDISLTCDDLTLTMSDGTRSFDGDMRLVLHDDGNVISETVSGSKLRFTHKGETGLLKDFTFSTDLDKHSSQWIQSIQAKIASSEIDGQIALSTITELQGTGDDYPVFGELKIEGANGSYVSLNADTGDDATVLLTVFDGSVTDSREVAWQTLD
ncbi:MAG: hypothetical protein KDJ38_11710 [Gammaproteobacteria bacterium]|nr:hypothetical protein [Gammaproteobacteria bacterium]